MKVSRLLLCDNLELRGTSFSSSIAMHWHRKSNATIKTHEYDYLLGLQEPNRRVSRQQLGNLLYVGFCLEQSTWKAGWLSTLMTQWCDKLTYEFIFLLQFLRCRHSSHTVHKLLIHDINRCIVALAQFLNCYSRTFLGHFKLNRKYSFAEDGNNGRLFQL